MDRRTVREQVMQTVFQMEATSGLDSDSIFLVDENVEAVNGKQGKELLSKLEEHGPEIDAVIFENIEGWKPERLPKTELAILRVAVCEMMYIDDVPTAVAINEAVELAKKYGGKNSGAFVNAVLGKIDKKGAAGPDEKDGSDKNEGAEGCDEQK